MCTSPVIGWIVVFDGDSVADTCSEEPLNAIRGFAERISLSQRFMLCLTGLEIVDVALRLPTEATMSVPCVCERCAGSFSGEICPSVDQALAARSSTNDRAAGLTSIVTTLRSREEASRNRKYRSDTAALRSDH